MHRRALVLLPCLILCHRCENLETLAVFDHATWQHPRENPRHVRGLTRIYDVRMAQFVLKIEKLSHIMGPRASQDLRSPYPIMAPGFISIFPWGLFDIFFFLFPLLINDRGKRHVFEWFSLYLFPYNQLFFNYLHLRIHPHYPHLLITRMYSITFSALILPTNHFVIKIRPSFHWWDITAAILLRKKERELEITQGYTQCDVV